MTLPAIMLTNDDEQRLHHLAVGMAKGLEDEGELLQRLGFTRNEYAELAATRTFRTLLMQATAEWEGASNTHKRVRLKAAVGVEQALPDFIVAMSNDKEPLSSRVKALEVVARIGALGNPELVPAGTGQFFKLEINLGHGVAPLVIENDVENMAYSQSNGLVESKVWADVERNEL